MDVKPKKELLIILILTAVFGALGFGLATYLDTTIATVNSTRYKIDELTRFATDRETRAYEYRSVQEYTVTLSENLPEIEDIIEILEQLETISTITGTQIGIRLEEGVIGEGSVEFEDEEERIEFLKRIEVKEFSPPEDSTEGQLINVALETQDQTSEDKLKINYLEVYISLKGSYNQIRSFITLLQDSTFVFDIAEIRLVKTTENQLEGNLEVRAFIFEK
jgi:hypothetical protein